MEIAFALVNAVYLARRALRSVPLARFSRFENHDKVQACRSDSRGSAAKLHSLAVSFGRCQIGIETQCNEGSLLKAYTLEPLPGFQVWLWPLTSGKGLTLSGHLTPLREVGGVITGLPR